MQAMLPRLSEAFEQQISLSSLTIYVTIVTSTSLDDPAEVNFDTINDQKIG
jgi:hypothetical protein